MSRLLEIFRPKKERLWKILCEEIGADYIPGKMLKGRHATIQAYHENWTIFIDTYTKPKQPTRTRIRAPYVNQDSFMFRVYRKPALDFIAKLTKYQDVVVGYPQFDYDFVIQGNDERKLKQLFDNPDIRELLSLQLPRQFLLENRPDENWMVADFREGISELYFETVQVITDLDKLRGLYDLFAEVLNHLCHLGSAYEDDPYLLRK
ncbi:MAG: DUF3137 domain-containing protein [Bacteroidota bacterium]